MLINKLLPALAAMLLLVSCSNDPDPVGPTLVKEWRGLALNSRFENPAVPGRTETGTADIQIFSDNTLKYTVTINNLLAGDAITAGHIHLGDALTNGPVFVGLGPVFSGNTATGTVTLRQTQVDSLQTLPIYLNFHSTQVLAGLVRAQMEKTIDFAADVALSGSNEVPPVTTTATGRASIRIMTDKTLYSKFTVSNLEAGDAFTAAHIHTGAAGTNGPVVIGLASGAADFNVIKTFTPDDAIINTIKTAAVYFNAHSTLRPAGVIRGQIR